METEYFHAHQDVAYPIRGLIILASKRHIKCFDELTEEERIGYMGGRSLIKGLYEAYLPVKDLVRSIEFYGKLGLKLYKRYENVVFLG
ncbi:hypothetical protein MHI57_19130 [Cytobacillus sp. FSL K6-0129]|uniref:hypothetical protein n=1 Tax=Cytobacillus sp. FSL K6-0129 TaxID=2921421 RepID=UPI0030FBF880